MKEDLNKENEVGFKYLQHVGTINSSQSSKVETRSRFTVAVALHLDFSVYFTNHIKDYIYIILSAKLPTIKLIIPINLGENKF